jgi:HTH-type transcriptional regulator/antitoxin HigA
MRVLTIKTEADYQAALQRAGTLMSSSSNTPEADELEVLATLIELYEDKYFPIESPDPIAAIEFRLEQLDRSHRDLIPLIGSESLVADVMSKRQPLTLEMIRSIEFGDPDGDLLAGFFDPGLVFEIEAIK